MARFRWRCHRFIYTYRPVIWKLTNKNSDLAMNVNDAIVRALQLLTSHLYKIYLHLNFHIDSSFQDHLFSSLFHPWFNSRNAIKVGPKVLRDKFTTTQMSIVFSSISFVSFPLKSLVVGIRQDFVLFFFAVQGRRAHGLWLLCSMCRSEIELFKFNLGIFTV